MFSRAKSIIFVTRRNIQLYSDEVAGAHAYEFPGDIVSNLELVNGKKFIQETKTFIAHNGLEASSAIIVLSDDVLFRKKIASLDDVGKKSETDDFLSKVPFDEENISYVVLPDSASSQIVVCNRQLYEYTQQVFEDLGWKILAVVPIVAFGSNLSQNGTLSADEVDGILSKSSSSDSSNFLKAPKVSEIIEASPLDSVSQSKNPIVPAAHSIWAGEELDNKKGSNKKQLLFGIAGVGLIVLAIGIVLFGTGNNPFTKKETEQSAQQERTPIQETIVESTGSATEASKSAAVNARELTVQVLNGTGVSGQAARARDAIKALGFEDFTLGNLGSTDVVDAQVRFSSKVSTSLRDKVLLELKGLFVDVNVSGDVAKNYDVEITTGIEK